MPHTIIDCNAGFPGNGSTMLTAARSLLERVPLFWRLQLAGWGSVAALGFILRLIAFQNTTAALVTTLIQDPLGFLLSCGLRKAYRRMDLSGGLTQQAIIPAVSFSLIAAIVDISTVKLITETLELQYKSWTPFEEWVLRTALYWSIFTGWSALYLWLKAEFAARANRERAAEAATNALRMELQLLRSQLDPHFLFNALNGIAAEIPVHPQNAHNMVCELADYLRFSLDRREHTEVSLSQELEAMAHYLRIEQARFGERLQVQIHADESALYRQIPMFLLQPLVENAVKHGLHTSEPPWDVSIQATAGAESLQITVLNSGSLLPQNTVSDRQGIGLHLLRRRLELLFPERHRFTLTQEHDMVCARLELEGEPCCV